MVTILSYGTTISLAGFKQNIEAVGLYNQIWYPQNSKEECHSQNSSTWL
jgi:hypothetical protein